ncbi:hypothetical protein [Enterobacter bugandensis]|uniref:hypothetical protein n=1 Tax=Enterobacter bugandensis TaxID=881260 RepID=UPI000AB7DAC5|nr:hypothetical protein [Enterobacter bugandensis]MCK6952886.1 hypothetical protein [Enterobacter bugandensis]MCK7209260.1 hypothetical protein [Enterobacter bugandensis]MCM7236391.1 hypothetical protein [Enterobacter bugandensis]MCM7315774.1 hypothetical protein [Enterobacter bugandensis]MCM7351329.1 hypothetical protein [Enterobacter bugandensis]
MLEMNLDVHTGFVAINNYPLELKDVDTFKNSKFYQFFSPLTKIGSFYYSIDNIKWKDQVFILELRPSVFSFSPSIFLTSKDGSFYKTLNDWDKRASLSNLSEERQRLTAWVENEITSKPKLQITSPHMEFNGSMNGEVLLYSLMKKASIVVFISNGMFD